jgi:DNA-binding beta-propeller fold protein YncE
MNNGEKIEKLLNKKLPIEYKNFLDSEGYLSKDGIEVYGYSSDLAIDKIPSVIGATKSYKKIFPIKQDELAISFDELENNLYILNLTNGKIYKLDINGNRILIFDNFKQFLHNIKGS